MEKAFAGKRGLVLGVANKRSIAWAIARRLAEGGAELAFTFQGERIESSVRNLAETVSSPLVAPCDVRSDEDVSRVFAEVGDAFDGGLDLLVHSVAFAAAEDLEGRFTDTPRDRFWLALDVSAYSLVVLTPDELYAVRDPRGFRPLNLGKFTTPGGIPASIMGLAPSPRSSAGWNTKRTMPDS